jgi:nicotinamide mononucleotide transporter
LSAAWIEWLAVFSALLAVGLGVLGRRITWVVWVISSLFYFAIFAQAKLWADSGLQLVFILAAIWGWLRWGKQAFLPGLMALRGRLLALLSALLTWLALFGLLSWLGGEAASGDAFVAAFSLVAQILMVRQRLEHWLFWIAANLTAVGLFWLQGLKATAGLYVLFALMALIGFSQWRRHMNQETWQRSEGLPQEPSQSGSKPLGNAQL